MASAKDLGDLADLLKLERKRARKAHEQQASAARERPKADAASGRARVQPAENGQPERFAELFGRWTEFAPPSAAEISMFRAAVQDATPLVGGARADLKRPKPSPHAVQREADELAALAASQLALYPSPMSWDIGADIEDEQSFLRGGVSPDLLRKLRRGEWTINAEIDLHHHNQDEAHAALQQFMRMARAAGWRCVRVIHGKGLSSHQKIPVLRQKVRRWLQQKDEVLAFCEPRPNGGGSGAVLVLLKGSR